MKKNVYGINLDSYSLEKFKERLLSRELLPGRRILLEDIENRFSKIQEIGVQNLAQLLKQLSSKKKIELLSAELKIPSDYLTILRREAGSFISTPVKLETIVDPENVEYLKELELQGIKNSKHLFEHTYLFKERKDLANELNMPLPLLTKWTELCDLLRINGVGPSFAFMLHDSGICRVEHFVTEEPEVLLERAKVVNNEKHYTNLTLSIKDLEYCMDYAKNLEVVLELD